MESDATLASVFALINGYKSHTVLGTPPLDLDLPWVAPLPLSLPLWVPLRVMPLVYTLTLLPSTTFYFAGSMAGTKQG